MHGCSGAVLATLQLLICLQWTTAGAQQQDEGCPWAHAVVCSEPYHVGSFVIASTGETACPSGTSLVVDSETCSEVAAMSKRPLDVAIHEGQPCYFASGNNPPMFRMNGQYGHFARMVCRGPQLEWPNCLEPDTVIRNAGQGLFVDLMGFGANIGCWLDDCSWTDKFDALSKESCAVICYSLPDCKYWVWGHQDGGNKCFFRTGDRGRQQALGWLSGKQSCVPPGTTVLKRGNASCWEQQGGYTYEACCNLSFGFEGDPNCWDNSYTYDDCCFPEEPL